MLSEAPADERLNLKLAILTTEKENLISEVITEFQADKLLGHQKSLLLGIDSYLRNLRVNYLAKVISVGPRNWIQVITQVDGKNFVEAHHLVPMAVQDYYQYTLDFTDNVTALYPSCHRLVHLARY